MEEKGQNNFWELVTSSLHNEISDEELVELDVLLKDENNKKLYQEIRTLKNDVKGAKNLRGVSKYNSWERISHKLRRKNIQLVWSITKYAAIIVFAFLMGNVITTQFSKQEEISGYAEVKVPLGQMSEMTLYDGTKVWLNSGTVFSYNTDFGKKERKVTLVGEAFFNVTKTGTPFKVKFKGKEVEVLGTKFNVVAYDDGDISQVTLVEGSVNINNPNGSVIATLEPSEQITIDEISQKAIIEKVETNFYVSWTDGKIVFDEETLSNITAKLERWYNVEIRFEDPSIADLKFSGTILKNKPFDQIIKAFELLLPLKIEYTHIPGGKDLTLISKK